MSKQALARVESSIGHHTRRERLAKLLPEGVSVDRFIQMVLDCVAANPKLAECTPSSLYLSVIRIAELGLEPGGALGEAWPVPYGSTAQPVIGYKGFCRLAYQSPRVKSIRADVVTAAEWQAGTFRVKQDRSDVVHEFDPAIGTPDEAELYLAYCRVELDTGGVVFRILNREQIHERRPSHWDRIRDSPWKAHPAAMWRKTAIRALLTSGEVPLRVGVLDALKALPEDEGEWVQTEPALDELDDTTNVGESEPRSGEPQ